jgi:hypothetical protein
MTLLNGAHKSLSAGYREADIDRLWPAIRRSMAPRFEDQVTLGGLLDCSGETAA